MLIAKWEKIDVKEILKMEYDKVQLLVYNNITDCWFVDTAKDICRCNLKSVEEGFWDVYILRFKGKEICTDDVDFQDELDMIDDGIFNYGEK